MQTTTAPILALSDDVLRIIFLELCRSSLQMRQLRKLIPASDRQNYCRQTNLYETPSDPVSISACSRVCRRWTTIIHDSSELQSSIIVALPLNAYAHLKTPARINDPRHIARFLELRGASSINPLDLRIYTCLDDRPGDATRDAYTASYLLPLVSSARSLAVHGACFLGRHVDIQRFNLHNLQVLALDNISIPDFREIIATYPYIKILKMHHITRVEHVSVYSTAPGSFGAPVACPQLEYFECYGFARVFFAMLRTMILQKKTRVSFNDAHGHWREEYRHQLALPEHLASYMWPFQTSEYSDAFFDDLFESCPGLRCMEFVERHEGAQFLSKLHSRRYCNLVELQFTRCSFHPADFTAFYDRISTDARTQDKRFWSLVLRDCSFTQTDTAAMFALLQDKVFSLEVIDTRAGFSQRTARD